MGGTDRGGPHGVCVSLLEKNADLLEFTLTVHTCFCNKSTDTFHITTMSCTWTEESHMTLYGSIVGAS